MRLHLSVAGALLAGSIGSTASAATAIVTISSEQESGLPSYLGYVAGGTSMGVSFTYDENMPLVNDTGFSGIWSEPSKSTVRVGNETYQFDTLQVVEDLTSNGDGSSNGAVFIKGTNAGSDSFSYPYWEAVFATPVSTVQPFTSVLSLADLASANRGPLWIQTPNALAEAQGETLSTVVPPTSSAQEAAAANTLSSLSQIYDAATKPTYDQLYINYENCLDTNGDCQSEQDAITNYNKDVAALGVRVEPAAEFIDGLDGSEAASPEDFFVFLVNNASDLVKFGSGWLDALIGKIAPDPGDVSVSSVTGSSHLFSSAGYSGRLYQGDLNLIVPDTTLAAFSPGDVVPSQMVLDGKLAYGVEQVTYAVDPPGYGTLGLHFTEFQLNSAVPEPATWALMLLGFGAIGCSLRRRKRELAIA